MSDDEELDEMIEAARLRQGVCADCGAPLKSHEPISAWGPNLMCGQCGTRHCPFCGAYVFNCIHYLGTTGEIDAELGGCELEPSEIDPESSDAGELESRLAARLGIHVDLLEHFRSYLEGEGWGSWTETLLRQDILQGHLGEPVVSLPWEGWWHGSSCGRDHFAMNGGPARRQFDEVWTKVTQALLDVVSNR